jgi:hypothetical protein
MSDDSEKLHWLKGIVTVLAIFAIPVAFLLILVLFSTRTDEGISPTRNEIRLLEAGFAYYYKMYQEYPQGSNRKTAQSFLGMDNKGRTPTISWPKNRLSKNGELLDRWGNPFYIKARGDRIEIRSAGPDHVLWNNDDFSNE